MEKSEKVLQGTTGRDGTLQTEGGAPSQRLPRARVVQVQPRGGSIRRLQVEGRVGSAYPRAVLQATEMGNTGVPTAFLARLRFRGVGVPAGVSVGTGLPSAVAAATRDDAVGPPATGGVVLTRRVAATYAAATRVVMAPVAETVPGAAGAATAISGTMAVAGAPVARAIPEVVAVATDLAVLGPRPAAPSFQVASAEVPTRVAARFPTGPTSSS